MREIKKRRFEDMSSLCIGANWLWGALGFKIMEFLQLVIKSAIHFNLIIDSKTDSQKIHQRIRFIAVNLNRSFVFVHDRVR